MFECVGAQGAGESQAGEEDRAQLGRHSCDRCIDGGRYIACPGTRMGHAAVGECRRGSVSSKLTPDGHLLIPSTSSYLKTAIPTATDEPDNLDDVHIQIMPSADHNQLTEMASLSGAGDFTGHIQQGFYYPEAKGMTSFEEMPHISPQQAFDSQANFWCMPSDIPIEYRQPGHIFVGHPSRSGNSSDMGNAMYPHEVSAPLSGAVMASGNVSYTPLHDPSSMPPPMNPYSLAA